MPFANNIGNVFSSDDDRISLARYGYTAPPKLLKRIQQSYKRFHTRTYWSLYKAQSQTKVDCKENKHHISQRMVNKAL